MRYLAIDPGVKECGMAWRSGTGNSIITVCAHVESDEMPAAICEAALNGAKFAVIEQANGFGPNVKAAFALCEARGRIIEACLRGHPLRGLIRLNVSTWQSAMLGKKREKGDTKKRSIESARSLGVDTDDHNIADAVNILRYAELNQLGVDDGTDA
jgi:hypothetical protein